MVDVPMGAIVTDNDAVGTVLPPSLTKDKGMYASVLVAFEGACIGVFANSAGHRGGNDDGVKSAVGEVGHKDHGPHL